nr:DUF2946 domain-containing protein [uncultured Pseudomonas sp.]
MNRTRPNRPLLAWMLYFSVLFAALVCSIAQGQLAGLQLSGIDGFYCSAGASGPVGEGAGFGATAGNSVSGFGCSLCSSSLGLAFAAFFTLLGLLALRQIRLNPALLSAARAVRYLWPSANPRASPFFA